MSRRAEDDPDERQQQRETEKAAIGAYAVAMSDPNAT